MVDQEKDDRGRFTRKSNSDRKIRSIRATDETWNLLGEKADEHDMTRADFLEALMSNEVELEASKIESDVNFDVNEIGKILKEALTLKSNAGGKIKVKIKKVLELMNIEIDNDD